MKAAERQLALQLLRRHPGWSDRRVALEVGVAPSTVNRWRHAELLRGYSKRVHWRRRRR